MRVETAVFKPSSLPEREEKITKGERALEESSICSLAKDSVSSMFETVFEVCFTVVYYLCFLWLVEAVRFRKASEYVAAKVMAFEEGLQRIDRAMQGKELQSYILSVENGGEELELNFEKKEKQGAKGQLEQWLLSQTKKRQCDLQGFSLSVYGFTQDRRWLRWETDRRDVSIVTIQNLSGARPFGAQVTTLDYDFVFGGKSTPKGEAKVENITMNL